MSAAPFLLVPLDAAAHDRSGFDCDAEPLNRYLREQASQDIRRRVAACFVALADGRRIAAYYTLAAASLLLTDLPASTRRKLPRYPTVPAVRMGRLAVDRAFKGARSWCCAAGRCARASRPFGDCRLRPDGGRQGREGSGLLPASRLHCPARLGVYPVSAAGNRAALLTLALPSRVAV
jgi:hypothetical protein